MDNFEKQKTLVIRLVELTKDGSVVWKEAVDTNSFRLDLSKNSVRIREVDNFSSIDYVIELIDEDGAAIDSFSDTELDHPHSSGPYFQAMKTLFTQARRSATGSDRVLNTILEDLAKMKQY